ncbi:Indoleamine 2,3-dioxygenase [Coprinopsis marcescibilis]|uniref:Indoleamine 2,3-dioxygenase n=1 Tax=Coprinopsis marcescibilis TaxID=230819 RepID=A0A5C3L6V7_COPMA|nr:Indoleamine 2,3-dioxygenase [Coprinopsis marcescibilis]
MTVEVNVISPSDGPGQPSTSLSSANLNAALTNGNTTAGTTTAANTTTPGGLPVGHVFDVDPRTGFMAPQPPISRLPAQWEQWEAALDAANDAKVQCGDKLGLTELEAQQSEAWRAQIQMLPVLPLTPAMSASPVMLRRAHVVLSFLLHLYVQTLPPHDAVIIPRSIALPILRVSQLLDVPPLLTFADTVLYNWDYKQSVRSSEEGEESAGPATQLDNLRSQTTFTGLIDEEEFYLCSARIELRGVEALELMRQSMDEMFVGDEIAVRRISGYLKTMATVVNELKSLLLDVRKHCDPEVYYNVVRPWFRGEDSDVKKRKWVYEGVEEDEDLAAPTELSGPSAGQSSLVHVLDVFLGVDHQSKTPDKPSFMSRMLTYMPRNHRLFLKHLSANPRPLRTFVLATRDAELLETYNRTVVALKEFRDAHMIIATLYIIGPARRAAKKEKELLLGMKELPDSKEPLKGTGGTDLVKFLKDTRDRTGATLIPAH